MINIKDLPNNPGCYLYKDKTGKIIYIGKAKDLKKRVSQYFTKKDHDAKTKAMVEHINEVDFIATNSEVEALILENNLIKKHTPKYNIDLKDSKRYASLKITKEEFPRLILSRKKEGEGKFFGPFVNAQSRDYIQYLLNKTFKIRTCRKLPKKSCLRYHLGICSAPCINNISKNEYQKNVDEVEMILKGKTKEIREKLKKQMKNASKKQNYEKAQEVKNRIEAIEWLSEKQKMERDKKYNEDIINFKVVEDKVYLMAFNIYHGTLENKVEFVFDFKKEFLEEFITRYYSENEVPKRIILPQKIDPIILEFLTKKRGYSLELIVPRQGELKELLNLVEKNIEISFFGDAEKLIELKKWINLPEIPNVIECFDVSHLSGTSTVASMVQFKNALPNKKNYRKFKIRSVEGIDDFASIAEVVKRRYTRLKKEKRAFPNLIVIDGGQIQLEFALNELKKLNIEIPIISLAKKFEEIYLPNKKNPLRLNSKNKARLLLQQIRDEAHRFAISYNRLLRKKELTK